MGRGEGRLAWRQRLCPALGTEAASQPQACPSAFGKDPLQEPGLPWRRDSLWLEFGPGVLGAVAPPLALVPHGSGLLCRIHVERINTVWPLLPATAQWHALVSSHLDLPAAMSALNL